MNKKNLLIVSLVVVLLVSVQLFTNVFKGDNSSLGARALDSVTTLDSTGDTYSVTPVEDVKVTSPTLSSPTPTPTTEFTTPTSFVSPTKTETTKPVTSEPVKESTTPIAQQVDPVKPLRELTVSKIIKYGMKKDTDVLTVQSRLIELGYLKGSADGSYGKMTVEAVATFQRANGIAVYGESVELPTLTALRIKLIKSNNTLSAVSSIAVVSPNGNEVYNGGQQTNVTWTSSNIASNAQVSITLQILNANNVSLGTVGVGTSVNDGQETVTLPTIAFIQQFNPGLFGTAVPGRHFKMLIGANDVNGQYVYDFSNDFFSINQPSSVFTITSPNGNEMYNEGQQVNVTWTSSNVPTNKAVNITLQVLNANNVSLGSIGIGNSATNDGQETVTMPTMAFLQQSNPTLFGTVVPGRHFKILGGTYDASNQFIYDYSNDFFSINTPTSSILTITSPNGNEVYTGGQQVNITWTSSSSIGVNNPVSINLQVLNANNVSLGTAGITTSVKNDGQETINMPSITYLQQVSPTLFGATVPGRHFKILIGANDNSGQFVYDFSNDFFTIN
jgi:peptidoglycan hydrolase-like protein with peptidoglycan-binding domain